MSEKPDKVVKTDEEWRAQLSDLQYHVAREHGTERAFSGITHDAKTPGIYNCICCDTPLFSSEMKYDSGTGWPSFWGPIADDAVRYKEDHGLFARRIEVLCSRCDAHLGHVFPDGPQPTGQRFCMNSASLDLAPQDAKQPAEQPAGEPVGESGGKSAEGSGKST